MRFARSPAPFAAGRAVNHSPSHLSERARGCLSACVLRLASRLGRGLLRPRIRRSGGIDASRSSESASEHQFSAAGSVWPHGPSWSVTHICLPSAGVIRARPGVWPRGAHPSGGVCADPLFAGRERIPEIHRAAALGSVSLGIQHHRHTGCSVRVHIASLVFHARALPRLTSFHIISDG